MITSRIKYLIYLVILLNSCVTNYDSIKTYYKPDITVDSIYLKIPFEFIKPYGVTEMYDDATTVEILQLNIDGNKIKREWCMCGLPEPEIIVLRKERYNVVYYADLFINKHWGFCDLHSGKHGSTNPREYRFPIGSKNFEIVYNILLPDDLKAGPYKVIFNLNWDDFLNN